MRIASIGTGISGSLTARLLSTQHEVTVFEANSYPGGHAHAVDVSVFGNQYRVDTAFMVFNRQTYPNFCRLLQLLQIRSQPSEMSFSVRCSKSGLDYQGSSLSGLFAQRLNMVRPTFLRMLSDIVRFNRRGNTASATGELKDGRTVGKFLRECRVGKQFVEQYLVPMAAAIWSTRPEAILGFPADFMLGFFANHGLMQIRNRPQWRTVTGGSRNYVAALLGPIENFLRLQSPIASVSRSPEGVTVTSVDGLPEFFDEVVFATHAEQSLKMLADPTPPERRVLSAFPYQSSEAVLHTDVRLLPIRKRAWASWNYHIPPGNEHGASVTYDLSRLQGHNTPSPILLTLNETSSIDRAKFLRTFTYHHPAYSCDSITAQRTFNDISGQNNHIIAEPIRAMVFTTYFSPLNLFYVYDEQDECVETIVAEVSNTPWKERHCYVLSEGIGARGIDELRCSHPKQFHVSPFMKMDLEYRWRLTDPASCLSVQLANFSDSRQLFSAEMELKRRVLDRRQLRRMTFRYPLMSLQIIAAIYYQALKLWWKQCPSYSHPKKQNN